MSYNDLSAVQEHLLIDGFDELMEPLDAVIENAASARVRDLAKQLREAMLPKREATLTIKLSGRSDDLDLVIQAVVERLLNVAINHGCAADWSCEVTP
jgi:threonine dehydratase